MILPHCEPADPRRIFHVSKNTFTPDIRNWFCSQYLLSELDLALQYALTEIRDAFPTMSRTPTSQFGLQTPQENHVPRHTLTQQQTPEKHRQQVESV